MGGLRDIAAETTATMARGSCQNKMLQWSAAALLFSSVSPKSLRGPGRDALGNSGTSRGHINNGHRPSGAHVNKCHSCSHGPGRENSISCPRPQHTGQDAQNITL